MGKPKKSKTAERGIKKESWIGLREKIKNAIQEALFPWAFVCLDCGKELGDEDRTHSLCPECRKNLPYITGTRCRYCGEPIEQKYDVCKHCQTARPYFDKAYAPFAYEGVIKKIILSYKDGNANYLYKFIAKFITDYYNALDLRCDAVCYVPSSKAKILRRGFEHNKKVTEIISKDTRNQLIYPLKVVKNMKDQTRKNRSQRLEDIKGVFAPAKGFDRMFTWGKTILLIDDVVTTGATAGECARVLKEELGAATVIVLALARA
ncbi:MAG: ComF family protein [Clostridia bacterium]|nr:ComF family protein [Clostridia bacterium]